MNPTKKILNSFFIVREGKWVTEGDASKVNRTSDMCLLGDVDPNNKVLSGIFFNELILFVLRFR
ncbi:hypothetical protein J2T15_003552 [Paenibacillus harenae]|uniref:Uncharacterized protein n=1 Tax=Paenibacillus harenae TaxID=306543 RepID=A0ABT9U383_PAEHA|nr:hypothetical protein [Paenibacillus harenae]